MSADSYFAIGSTHQVCQDHAISDGDFVVLSDGCSSAKDSDWGARLITRTAYNILKQTKPTYFDKFVENVIKGAYSHSEKLDLHRDCLAATFLCAWRSQVLTDKMICVGIVGDGYIIAKSREGNRIKIISHMYETGAPWYPLYTLEPDLVQGYLTYYGHGSLIIEKTTLEDGNVVERDEFNYPMKAETTRVPSLYSFGTDEYDMVGISSDGLKTFVQQVKGNTSITNKPVGERQVVKDLFAFKTTEGQFVHRRCQRYLKDCVMNNIKHTDDFSLGVLHA